MASIQNHPSVQNAKETVLNGMVSARRNNHMSAEDEC